MTTVAPRSSFLGLSLDALTLEEAVARCAVAVAARENLTVGVLNAAKIVHMRADRRLRDSVTSCDLVLADGQSVVWASRVLGQPLPERVAGIDLFTSLMEEGSRRGWRVYFLGARPDVLGRMLTEVRRRYPGLVVAGARDGYFADHEAGEVAGEIGGAGPDLLFLGMTSPKKEIFLAEWAGRIKAGVVHGVGGSFDVLAGYTRRAPRSWQRLGLEWLHRLLQEPRRLGPRYLSTNLAFVRIVLSEYTAQRRAR
ncbi:WecB/TagA/CpsF family glycosyltransferase [Planomonospora sp. ID67723]|uniref:WecB/TagA/CpsF family glycosyltransferase n=1 Tax=Planomonospora sp. ID67723 TaxID=2738134 RepID=UPI0018C36DD4|nr:WecB/TagA/CpsF family glycosyltransferase [Planomonospora sp. ID67723]MBG0827435.1 WecB/TagA/CpsF family glycosyltransferase [Planomonospora sp. ID67723]